MTLRDNDAVIVDCARTPMARVKCDTAHSARKAQRNGTANTSSAEACTSQKTET